MKPHKYKCNAIVPNQSIVDQTLLSPSRISLDFPHAPQLKQQKTGKGLKIVVQPDGKENLGGSRMDTPPGFDLLYQHSTSKALTRPVKKFVLDYIARENLVHDLTDVSHLQRMLVLCGKIIMEKERMALKGQKLEKNQEQMQRKVNHVQNKFEKSRKKEKELESKVTQLTQQLEEYSIECEELFEEYESEKNELTHELHTLKLRSQQTQNKLYDSEKMIAQLKQKLQQSQEENRRIKEVNRKQGVLLKKLDDPSTPQSPIKALSSSLEENEELKSQFARVLQERQDFERKYLVFKAENQRLTRQINDMLEDESDFSDEDQ